MIRLKSQRDIGKMRKAGSRLADAFLDIMDLIKPGVTTAEIDRRMEAAISSNGSRPAFKGYGGHGLPPFPAATCISVEREVVHGVPSERTLEAGQIVGIDAGLELDGWFADMAGSFLVGDCDPERVKLWRITRDALYRGIAEARVGRTVGDIGAAVQDYVESNGFSVIRDLVGHGIGAELHEEPPVPNYRTSSGRVKLQSGMTLAIEPMVAVGRWQIRVLSDQWTVVTADGRPSAHFEHTVLVTGGEPEILTLTGDGRDPWLSAALDGGQ